MFTSSAKIIFLACFLSTEAARMNQKKKIGPGDDLDWEECASFSCDKEGCATEKLWLDIPRQSCRYTEEHKLKPELITKFFPVELDRLTEKSAKFARTGCLFGGWWAKCYRRIRQIVRLSKYVRRAKAKAEKFDSSHEAYVLVTSSATQKALDTTAKNIAAGFKKHSESSKFGFDFEQGFTDIMNLQASAKAIEEQAASQNQSLSPVQKQAVQDTLTLEAMLKAKGVTLTDEQRAALYAKIEAGADLQGDELDESLIEQEEQDLDGAFDAAERDSNSNELFKDLQAQENDDNSTEEGTMSLIETASQTAVATRGTGPLKWIFKHGLGWLITRIGWLLMFLIGTVIGVIRAALFPILFIGCTAIKFVVWLFRDVGYNLMWEGDYQLTGNRFLEIGRCAPVMWDAVGFDPTQSAGVVAGQIFIQPAAFASKVTGVHHLWKSESDLCNGVQCGAFATCYAGSCLCNAGYYPINEQSPDCGLASTEAGCACQPVWSSGKIFTQTHYGCPTSKFKCKIDESHETWSTCKSNLGKKKRKGGNGGLGDIADELVDVGAEFLFGKKAPEDRCTPPRFRAEVPPKSKKE